MMSIVWISIYFKVLFTKTSLFHWDNSHRLSAVGLWTSSSASEFQQSLSLLQSCLSINLLLSWNTTAGTSPFNQCFVNQLHAKIFIRKYNKNGDTSQWRSQGASLASYEVSQLISQQRHSRSGGWGQEVRYNCQQLITQLQLIGQLIRYRRVFEQWQNLGFGTTTAAFGNILNSGFGPQAVGQRFL